MFRESGGDFLALVVGNLRKIESSLPALSALSLRLSLKILRGIWRAAVLRTATLSSLPK